MSPARDDQTTTDDDVSYLYDAAGRLIARSNPNGTGSAKTTLYFYRAASDNLAEESDGTGQTMVRYLADDNGTAIAQETYGTSSGSRAATSAWTWLLHDPAGSVATTTDDTGTVLEQSAYDRYGQPKTGGSGKTTSTSYGGSSLGHESALTDRDSTGTTRAVIQGGRQYDPSTRRYTTAAGASGQLPPFIAGPEYAYGPNDRAGSHPDAPNGWPLRVGRDITISGGTYPDNNRNFGWVHTGNKHIADQPGGPKVDYWPNRMAAEADIRLALQQGFPIAQSNGYLYVLPETDRTIQVVVWKSRNTGDGEPLGLKTAWVNWSDDDPTGVGRNDDDENNEEDHAVRDVVLTGVALGLGAFAAGNRKLEEMRGGPVAKLVRKYINPVELVPGALN